MKRAALLLFLGVLLPAAGMAADRSISVPPKVATSWGFLTNSTAVKQSRTLGVGFWQRASGAKPGVGEIFASAMEFQLPEAAPSRLRSATFRFSGKPSQCVGTEPVVVDVHAYSGDGKGDVSDVTSGSKVAQLSADCTDHAAFSRPIDVTHIVRQTMVSSGIRHVGFNVRKANNRQGPGLFALAPGQLTVVIADQDLDRSAMGRPGLAPGPRTPGGAALPAPVSATPAAKATSPADPLARRTATAAPVRKDPAPAGGNPRYQKMNQ
jgi:hypothetical protein